jgi:crotonobetainyl-CoA:carnitine CoA-transferase CaiB-like acyl-CoA transferase
MSAPEAPKGALPLAKALIAFQKAQELTLSTHRKLAGASREDADRFWAGTGARLEQHLRECATAVVAAYKSFSADGGIAAAGDRRLVNEAHQLLHDRAMPPKPDLISQREEWKASQQLRDLIHEELERRGITDLAEVGTAQGLPARDADRLMRRGRWLDGDVELLQAAAARLGLPV